MNPLLQQYQEIRNELVDYLEKLTDKEWNLMVHEGWTVKDLVAHLSGWAEYQINCLRLFAGDIKDIPEPKVEERNQESVAKRRKYSAKEIKEEFIALSSNMIKAYGSLTDEQWQKPIWAGTKTTPEKFIKIEVKHYQETHFPELRKVCNFLK